MQYQQQQQQIVVVTAQPQATTFGQPQNIRDWSSGLCGCCEDIGSCCLSTFCHPCFMCMLSGKMDECYCGPFCCGEFFVISMRTKLRTQYGITGSIIGDCCCVAFCHYCVSCQMYRELKTIRGAI